MLAFLLTGDDLAYGGLKDGNLSSRMGRCCHTLDLGRNVHTSSDMCGSEVLRDLCAVYGLDDPHGRRHRLAPSWRSVSTEPSHRV